MTSEYLFTSESVSEGHPDKIADQISDAVLDAHLAGDPASRIACETLVKNNTVILAAEITSKTKVDYTTLVRKVVREIGYTEPRLGFDADSCEILNFTSPQSPDISQGVTEGEGLYEEQGAGDQGLMFGFACNETPELMPLPISLSHALTRKLAATRKTKRTFLQPDAKSQVTVRYRDGKPVGVATVVVSTQHDDNVDLKEVQSFVLEEIIRPTIPAHLLNSDTRYLINPTGRFVIGGPLGDCGLTGRKIIVDSYGGYSRHGGGAFSGKDPSKVDRSAAYAARYVAKNIVAAEIAERCEVQIAYAIGVAAPVSVYVSTFGTGKVPDQKICEAVKKVFDLRPRAIIQELKLTLPVYLPTASYGHFGRQPTDTGLFSWERVDRIDQIKGAL